MLHAVHYTILDNFVCFQITFDYLSPDILYTTITSSLENIENSRFTVYYFNKLQTEGGFGEIQCSQISAMNDVHNVNTSITKCRLLTMQT